MRSYDDASSMSTSQIDRLADIAGKLSDAHYRQQGHPGPHTPQRSPVSPFSPSAMRSAVRVLDFDDTDSHHDTAPDRVATATATSGAPSRKQPQASKPGKPSTKKATQQGLSAGEGVQKKPRGRPRKYPLPPDFLGLPVGARQPALAHQAAPAAQPARAAQAAQAPAHALRFASTAALPRAAPHVRSLALFRTMRVDSIIIEQIMQLEEVCCIVVFLSISPDLSCSFRCAVWSGSVFLKDLYYF